MILDNIRIVLVQTITPGNIGASARAMKNMGLNNLYLVKPKDFPHEQSTWRASHATDVLDKAVICDSLSDAISDCHLVIGTSARTRYIRSSLVTPEAAAKKIVTAADKQKIAVVFGREDRGLTNDELQQCHLHLSIPTSEYSSLNLAAAVQVVCYELYKASLQGQIAPIIEPERDLATQKQIQDLIAHLEKTLLDLKFYRPHQPTELMSRLRRLVMRAKLDDVETNILRGILASVDRVITTNASNANS